MPDNPNANAMQAEIYICQEEIKKALLRQLNPHENSNRAYVLIYNQCSPITKTRLKGSNDFKEVKKSQDVVQLLTLICGIFC